MRDCVRGEPGLARLYSVKSKIRVDTPGLVPQSKRAIDLDQDESRRVVALLEHVEARDPGLFEALLRVGSSRRFERRDGVRLQVNVDENDQHGISLRSYTLAGRGGGGRALTHLNSSDRAGAENGLPR
jgi:hypothetical protein